MCIGVCSFFFFQAEDGIRDAQESRGLGDVYKRQSLDELLPTSRAYGRGHGSLFGLVAGLLVMAFSLLLMK